jgi:hypothetical protein
LQPPYVGAECCDVKCKGLTPSGWRKSKSEETLGKPLCAACYVRDYTAAKKAPKVGRCRLTVDSTKTRVKHA